MVYPESSFKIMDQYQQASTKFFEESSFQLWQGCHTKEGAFPPSSRKAYHSQLQQLYHGSRVNKCSSLLGNWGQQDRKGFYLILYFGIQIIISFVLDQDHSFRHHKIGGDDFDDWHQQKCAHDWNSRWHDHWFSI